MKKIVSTLTAMLILAALIQPDAAAQRYRKRETYLIDFKVKIDEDYKRKFEQFASIFPQGANKTVSPVENLIRYTTWDIIKSKLTDRVGMIILPLNAYGKKFSYDDFGFPNVAVSRAIRKGESKYYIKLELEIVPEYSSKFITITNPDTANQIVQLQDNELKADVIVRLTIYNDKGIIPIKTCEGRAHCDEVVTLDEHFFDGIANGAVNPSATNLYNLIDKATDHIIVCVL